MNKKKHKMEQKAHKKTRNQFCIGYLFLGMGPALDCGEQS